MGREGEKKKGMRKVDGIGKMGGEEEGEDTEE